MEVRRCRVCSIEKPLTAFPKDGNRRSSRCNTCAAVATRRYNGVVDDPEMKRCNKCGETKPLNCYYKNPNGDRALYSVCKSCHRVRTSTYRQDNPQVNREAGARWRAKHPDYRWATQLRLQWRMTPADYDALMRAQGGVCAICGHPERWMPKGKKTQRLAIDHDHATGFVRGLLCRRCNQMLGQYEDDAALLRRAADYLEGRLVEREHKFRHQGTGDPPRAARRSPPD